MPSKNDPKDKELTPREAAKEVEPRSGAGSRAEDDDPREEEGWDQPQSSAQKTPEPGPD